MRDEDFGTIRIKLEEVIQQSDLSKIKSHSFRKRREGN